MSAHLGAVIKGERVPPIVGGHISSMSYSAVRLSGDSIGEIRTHGRTSKAKRQDIADRLATPVETAEVTLIEGRGAYATYRINFYTTHRIIPVENFGEAR